MRRKILFIIVFCTLIVFMNNIKAEQIPFSALNTAISEYEDLPINAVFEEGLGINGEIWYLANGSYKKGSYNFVFSSREFSYPFTLGLINLTQKETYLIYSPVNTLGGYSNRFRFEDNNNNLYEGFFDGTMNIIPYDVEDYSWKEIHIVGHFYFYGEDKRKIEGTLKAEIRLDENNDIENFNSIVILDGFEFDTEKRISTLESLTETLNGILSSINSLFSNSQNHETRIITLENTNITQPNITIQNYWKYLDSGVRKDIVCGIGTDNHLTTLTMQELGYTCTISYRQTSKGEKASCRCNKI